MNSGAIPRSLKQKANSTPPIPPEKETQNAVFKLCWGKKKLHFIAAKESHFWTFHQHSSDFKSVD